MIPWSLFLLNMRIKMVLPQPSRIAMWGCPEWPIRKWIPGVCNTNLYQYTNNRDIVGLSAKLFNRHSKNVTTNGKDVNTHQFDVMKVALSKAGAASFSTTRRSLHSCQISVLTY